MRFLFYALLSLCSSLFCAQETTNSISVNAAFTITIPLDTVPTEAMPALQSYLNMIHTARPLPTPYILESYQLQDHSLSIKGRFLKEGVQDLCLGTFVWGNFIFPFPHYTLHIAPSSQISLGPKDMLLPFPQLAYSISNNNVATQAELSQKTVLQADALLDIQRQVRISLIFILLLGLITPAIRIFLAMRPEKQQLTTQTVSLKEELQRLPQASWAELLVILRKVSKQGVDVTAYELAQYFANRGENNFAHASRLVESYGYRQESYPKELAEAISCVRSSLS